MYAKYHKHLPTKFATGSAVLNSDLENEHLKVSELKNGSANTA